MFDGLAITFLSVEGDAAFLDAPDGEVGIERFSFIEQLQARAPALPKKVQNAAERALM